MKQPFSHPSEAVPSPARLDVLDGLRGLAVVVVLASHFSGAGLFSQPALHGVGKSGVYLFFVLSAYLLARNLLRLPAGSLVQSRVWLDYALRRVLRIWPLYLVVVLLSWLTWERGGVLIYAIDTASLWRHLALREGVSALWSIPVEFTFYAWLPLLVLGMVAMARLRWSRWVQAYVFLVALILSILFWPPSEAIENDVRLAPYLAVFLCGVFAALVDGWLGAARRAPRAWTIAGVAALLAWCAAVPVVWCWLTGRPFEPTITRSWFLFFGVLWSVLLLAVLHGGVWLRTCFAWRPLRWLGMISYSLYLWHLPVIGVLQRAGLPEHAPLLAPAVILAAALLVAWVSYQLFERPLQRVRLRERR